MVEIPQTYIDFMEAAIKSDGHKVYTSHGIFISVHRKEANFLDVEMPVIMKAKTCTDKRDLCGHLCFIASYVITEIDPNWYLDKDGIKCLVPYSFGISRYVRQILGEEIT